MTRVLVTGATGFIGRTLCETLGDAGYVVRAALRTEAAMTPDAVERVVVGDIDPRTDWSDALRGVDAIVHLAARAHVVRDSPANADLYFAVNEQGTATLAAAAAKAGVHHLVYLSSIKVNGEETTSRPFTADEEPFPRDAYGSSKWRGEQRLLEIAARSDLRVSIVRPPLVYGPGVRANFLRLMHWVDRGLPLPLANVTNRRSLVSVWNLCDLLVRILAMPMTPARVWMAADGEDLSTPDLIRRIGQSMQRRVRLLPVPVGLLYACGALIGREAEVKRLCGSLVVDISKTRTDLQWCPRLSVDESLSRTVTWYRSQGRSRGN